MTRLASYFTTTTRPAYKMKKVSHGQYRYRGFLIRRFENENGQLTNAWDICEDTPGGWVPCDRLSTLRDCKAMIDR